MLFPVFISATLTAPQDRKFSSDNPRVPVRVSHWPAAPVGAGGVIKIRFSSLAGPGFGELKPGHSPPKGKRQGSSVDPVERCWLYEPAAQANACLTNLSISSSLL
ncbi:hypothetical protein GGP41_006810 [Bipolaris sorokiniana]|uniref:Uncharacterized protein n=1 Tax=Cochliobolus sativus TaxID=45130 RepID=A0A8H6DZE2_COCSA|nr:hypothetical protein GGP41_006810 [Bipolaris sorokiniana]